MNNDGYKDIVVGGTGSSNVTGLYVFYNNGSGGFTQDTISTNQIHNGVVGDIDGNGNMDIVGSGETGHTPVRLWRQ